MSVVRHTGFAAPLAACLLLAAPAWRAPPDKAPTKAERASARDAYDKGTLAFEKGDYPAALEGFTQANAIIPSIQAEYWIAQTHDRLGHTEIAIKGYEGIQARADFSKLSPDKASKVRERLVALKSPPPPPPPPVAAVEEPPAAPPPPPVAEQFPPPAPPPPPVVVEPPPAPITPTKLLPKANTFELGVMAGMLFVSRANNLVQDGHSQAKFEKPSLQTGLRAAYFPLSYLGVEAEYAHGFGRTEKSANSSSSARFDIARAHVVGQLPFWQFVPFAILGAGILHGNSNVSGADTDALFEAGVGAKIFATKLLTPRVDFRLNMTQKKGGGFSDGLVVHPEILFGLSFRLGSGGAEL